MISTQTRYNWLLSKTVCQFANRLRMSVLHEKKCTAKEMTLQAQRNKG